MLSAAATAHGTTLLSVPGKLATLVGEADSALLLSGQQAEGTPLASLGPAIGLARLARGEIDRDTFARQYGHRGSHEVELSIPRPAEDPAWIDDQLAALARHRPRRRRAAGKAGSGPRRGLGAAGTPGPQEGGRGAQAHRALGAGRP